jgi:ATP-dependent DNA helicase DinG
MGFRATSEGDGVQAVPWASAHERGLAFVAIRATGSDTSLDRIVGVHALRRDGAGAAEELELAAEEIASSGLARLVEFVGERVILAADGDATRNWLRHHGRASAAQRVLGLAEIASVVAPARARQVASALDDAHAIERELAELVRDFQALDAGALELLDAAWTLAWRGLLECDPTTAERLAAVLRIVHHGLRSSALRGTVDALDRALGAIDELAPRCATIGAEWKQLATVPVGDDELRPFDESELGLVDDVFRVHLPALLAASSGSYRAGQHEVARQVAATLGSGKLLLVHAPTGTGKTLAYLVPALLWSVRHDVRVGVSTYTRALQEQAIDQDVPLALRALARAGWEAAPRITLLKGRANYLCWRALKLQVPSEDDRAESWLAWASLVLFALTDEDGDLDRFPMRAALAAQPTAYLREIETLVRAVGAAPACCKTRADRDACAAEVARLRAERSHVVVTNHSFALARQAFFRHMVFDECEHLHDQAGSAWSHTITLRDIREHLSRLRQPGRTNARGPLDRLERSLFDGLAGSELLQASVKARYATLGALEGLQTALDGYRAWRGERQRGRETRDEHSLLREFVELIDDGATPAARLLVDARVDLTRAATELEATLSQLAAEIDSLHLQGAARTRRQLELERTGLMEWLAAVEAWLPMQDGQVRLRQDTFHDVEEDARGEIVLAARVLLPNEFLGRHYYPQLKSAVFISATTWLRGGFESALGLLGLDRAAQPAEDEVREPREIATFRAADPFDYARVAVCVPNDAPSISASREAFSAYVRDFIAQLGERTRGRMLVLFTNSDDARRTGNELTGFFRARGLPLWFQNMPGVRKEELGLLFRERVDSILLGVDTFWYGADFPGETLEYLVIVKLPYGVPDRYHHAQCAALGQGEQRRRIYLPRALAKFRQGFGRLMRRESDRGCVFVLDSRILVGANKLFLGELPLDSELGRSSDDEWPRGAARLVVDSTERCIEAALEHMQRLGARPSSSIVRERPREPAPRILEIAPDDVPF